MPDLDLSRPTPNSGNSLAPHHGYDPNQPRVPLGHSDGRQWTNTPGGGSPTIARREAVVDHSKQESWGSYVDAYRGDGALAEQRVFNRDGSRIVSEFKPARRPRRLGRAPHHRAARRRPSSHSRIAAMCSGSSTANAIWSAPRNGPRTVCGLCPTGEFCILGPAISAGANIASRLGPAAAQALNAAALTFFTWRSSRKDPNRTAVFAFNAKKYEKPETDEN